MEESAVDQTNTLTLEHVAMLAQLSVILQVAVLELVRKGFVFRRLATRLPEDREQRVIRLLIVLPREQIKSVAPKVVSIL
jgi:hypothetical protein